MTRLLKQTKSYLKDSKRTVLSDKHFTKLVQYLNALKDEALPEESKDHALLANVTEGDILTRIGTHSQLFE